MIFVAWDNYRVHNASLTAVFHDNYKALWSDDSLIEACQGKRGAGPSASPKKKKVKTA